MIKQAGGEAWSVTEFEKGIKSFEWIDNDTILFSADQDASLFERNTKERKDDTTVVDDSAHESPVRLYKFSIKDKKVARVTDNTDWIGDFDVSRDGKWAVAVASRELSLRRGSESCPGYVPCRFSERETDGNLSGWEDPALIKCAGRATIRDFMRWRPIQRSAVLHRYDYEDLFLRCGCRNEYRSESGFGTLDGF